MLELFQVTLRFAEMAPTCRQYHVEHIRTDGSVVSSSSLTFFLALQQGAELRAVLAGGEHQRDSHALHQAEPDPGALR